MATHPLATSTTRRRKPSSTASRFIRRGIIPVDDQGIPVAIPDALVEELIDAIQCEVSTQTANRPILKRIVEMIGGFPIQRIIFVPRIFHKYSQGFVIDSRQQ